MLYDNLGNRKYLTAQERRAFIRAARKADPKIETFCLTLAYTGARISEVLALTSDSVDFSVRGITIQSLKKRRKGVFRTVPVPEALLDRLEVVHGIRAARMHAELHDGRLWPWCRTTAWKHVTRRMCAAGIAGAWAVPKGLRHGLGVEGCTDARIPLNIIQKWLGHSRLETTAIYAGALGREERMLAARLWT